MVRKKRYTKYKQKRKNTRKLMRGGNFSQNEIQQLKSSGFTDRQIEELGDINVSFNIIMQKFNDIQAENPNEVDVNERVTIELLDELIFNESIPHADNDVHELDISLDDTSFHLDDLAHSNIDSSNSSGLTTRENISFIGGTKRTLKRKKRKTKRRKRMRGGTCYGNGVGANSYDPNYSIYNTNMRYLFPYKPQ